MTATTHCGPCALGDHSHTTITERCSCCGASVSLEGTPARIKWFVWGWGNGGPAQKLRHTANMRGTWGWDAECSCGWGSHTGGATKKSVADAVWFHKHFDHNLPFRTLRSERVSS